MSPAHILYIIFTKGPIAPKPLKNKTKQLKKIPSKKAETLTYEAVVSKEWGGGGGGGDALLNICLHTVIEP